MSQATKYGIGAVKVRKGWIFGLTGLQITLVLAALFPAWLCAALGRWLLVLPCIGFWALACLLVCYPVRGRSAAQWIGVLLRHGWGIATGWSKWQSKAASGEVEDPREADLPGVLAGVEIHDGPPMAGSGRRVAVIQSHSARTWAATARIRHPGIGLKGFGARDHLGECLAELMEASSQAEMVTAIAFAVRTVPDDGAERADWVSRKASPDAPALSVSILAELDATLLKAAVKTEQFVTVVIAEDRIAREAKDLGRGVLGRARVLYGVLEEVETRLLGGLGCKEVTWLDSAELAAAVRTGFDPGDAAGLAEAEVAGREDSRVATGVDWAAAGAAHASSSLRAYRHGDWQSMSAALLLPKQGAVLGAIQPMLTPAQLGERRALTVIYRPQPGRVAGRKTTKAQMSASTSSELRKRAQVVENAEQRRVRSKIDETDEKLADGRALVATYGVVSITVPGTWDAAEHGRRLYRSVRDCGFTPQPLDGAHDTAFAVSTIPLGVGLPRLRGH